MSECSDVVVDHDTTGQELFHWVCECNWDLALCGTDVTGHRVRNPNDDICVVCSDLFHLPCPRCGDVA